jgi:hypothetical protein
MISLNAIFLRNKNYWKSNVKIKVKLKIKSISILNLSKTSFVSENVEI